MKNIYEVYVSDSNGWDDGCTNYLEVFFGELQAGEEYISPCDGGSGPCGSLLVRGYAKAIARRDRLMVTGEFIRHGESEETRPTYALREWRD